MYSSSRWKKRPSLASRFLKVINNVNKYIDSIAPEEFKGKWLVSVQDGSVAFGSAKDRWSINFNTMSRLGIKFSDVVDAYEKEQVNELAKKVRHDLGESLSQIQIRKVPLIKATTHSLEALKLYSDATVAWSQNQWSEAQTLWSHAIELDSGFAWANAALGVATEWLVSQDSAHWYFDRALNDLDRVTEKERLWITALATKGQQSVDAYQTYLQQYPDDRDGWYNLGNKLRSVGRVEDAI